MKSNLGIASAAVLATCLLSSCGSSSSDDGDGGGGAVGDVPSSAAAQPKTVAAAKKLANEELSRFSSGDYAGAWDLWSRQGKAAITRGGYEKLSEACSSGGVPLKIVGTRQEDPNTIVVRIGVGGFTQAYDVVYESSQWRWQPDADSIADYKLGVDKAIAKRKADGGC